MKVKNFIFIGLAIVLIAVFVYAANLSITGNEINQNVGGESLTLKVKIPCPGHAFLIEEALKDNGVFVEFRFPNYFDIQYDPLKISKPEILNLDIFDKYPAEEVSQ